MLEVGVEVPVHMSTTNWIEQHVNAPKRKRAGLVCVACHEKKIRCDLQSRDNTRCSHCMSTGQECRHRPSKRGNHGASQRPRPPPPPQQIPSPPVTQSHQINENENALCTPPQSTAATNETLSIDYAPQPAQVRINEAYSTFSHGGNYPYPIPAVNHNESSATPQLEMVPRTAQSWPASSPQSSRNKNSEPYLNESGFLQVYTQESRDYRAQAVTPEQESLSLEGPGPDLLQSFIETYFRSCYAWCPVLDRETLPSDLARSPLLVKALALASTHIRPPIIPSIKPSTYYARAKHMFYNDEEDDPTTCLQAISLFYWWSPRPIAQLHKDAACWWTALSVRQAQQLGYHRELPPNHPSNADTNHGLRRRIWWTLFARERITAICQGRPCLIDPEDCNVPLPTLDDFPDPTNPKAEVFIYWVRLCAILGRVAKYRSRVTDVASLAFPSDLADDLIAWEQSLPLPLKLPIETNRTTNFDRDVHQLHLPYLAVIIILHLSPSSQPLPRAYVPAIMAASCIARIFKDYLARGNIRFLTPVSGWICGIATLALLRASRREQFTLHAEEDIKILVIALKELRLVYPVADVFLQGFERLRAESASAGDDDDFYTDRNDPNATINNGVEWTRYFPYVTEQTSGLANALLTKHNDSPFLDEAWLGLMPLQLQGSFSLFENFPGDLLPMI